MRVTLMGPGELGHWFITDQEGSSFPLVEHHEDHPAGASMLGWITPKGITNEEEIIQDALGWLMDHTGEDFTAPAHVAAFFREFEDEE
jgi:hypothetical protein